MNILSYTYDDKIGGFLKYEIGTLYFSRFGKIDSVYFKTKPTINVSLCKHKTQFSLSLSLSLSLSHKTVIQLFFIISPLSLQMHSVKHILFLSIVKLGITNKDMNAK